MTRFKSSNCDFEAFSFKFINMQCSAVFPLRMSFVIGSWHFLHFCLSVTFCDGVLLNIKVSLNSCIEQPNIASEFENEGSKMNRTFQKTEKSYTYVLQSAQNVHMDLSNNQSECSSTSLMIPFSCPGSNRTSAERSTLKDIILKYNLC